MMFKNILKVPPKKKKLKLLLILLAMFAVILGGTKNTQKKVAADIVNPGDSIVYYWGNADRTFGWKLGTAWGDLGQDYAASAMIMSSQVATYCIQPNVILHSGSTVSDVQNGLNSQAAGWSSLSDATKQQINNVVYASRTLMNGQPSNDYPLYAYTQGWVWNLVTGFNGGQAPTQAEWQPDTTALGGVVSTITWSQMANWGAKIQALLDTYNVSQKGKDASPFTPPSFSGKEYTLIYGQTLKVTNNATIMGSSTNLSGLKDPATGLDVTGLNFDSTGLNNSVSGSSISFTAQKPVNQTFTVNYTASAKGEAGSTSNNWDSIGLTALVVQMNGGEQNQMVSTAPVTYTTTTQGNPSNLSGSFKVKEIAFVGVDFTKTLTHNGKPVANNAVNGIDITKAVYTLFDSSGNPATVAEIGNSMVVDNGKQLSTTTFSPDANGRLKLNKLLGGNGGYYLQETTAPDGTDLDTGKYKFDIDGSFNSNPSSLKQDSDGVMQTTLTGDKGSHDNIKTFGFDITKEITMSGTSLADGSILNHSEFTSGTTSYINQNKEDLTKVTLQLQYDNGTPVKGTDKGMMAFFDSSDMEAGTEFIASDGSVQFHPDKDGNLKVHDLVAGTNSDVKLKEIATPDRTTITNKVITISTSGSSTSSDYESEKDDNTNTGAKGFQDDIDYTGINLIKQENYLGTTDATGTLGATGFAGAQYTLFDSKDNQVTTTDPRLEKMTMSSDTHLTPINGNVVFTVDKDGTIANIDNLIWDGYYLLETKAATGMHLDTAKHYFGDSDKNAVATAGQPDKQSATKETSDKSVDKTKLVGDELEKQGQYTQTTSPFGKAAYDPSTNSTSFTAGAVSINDYNSKKQIESNTELGKAIRSGAVYQLFYAANTNDKTGTANKPVGNTDPAIAHLKITKGTQIQTDYTTGTGVQIQGTKNFYLATSNDKANNIYGRIGVINAAYQGYYWKEVQAPAGFQIDHNEYYWGAGYGILTNYVGNGTDNNVDVPETQTNTTLSQTDTTANYLWDNTFDKGNYGSTDHILTFGFNSQKMAVNSENQSNNGENGIDITLTPIDGTLGDPIKTTTYTKQIPNTNGGQTSIQGYFEFRTVPFGSYKMTSSAGTGLNNGLMGMAEIDVTYARSSDGLNYTLTFTDPSSGVVLSQFSSDPAANSTGAIPNQKYWDTVANADSSVNTFPNMTGDEAGKDDNYNGYDTVAPNVSDTIGKVANELFIDNAGFDVNDLPPKDKHTIQPHKFDLLKPAVNITNNTLLNDDSEIANNPAFALTGDASDPATAETEQTFQQEVTNTANNPSVDSQANNSAENNNNKFVKVGQTYYYQLWLDTRSFANTDNLTLLQMTDKLDTQDLTVDMNNIVAYNATTGDKNTHFKYSMNGSTLTLAAELTKPSTDGNGKADMIVDTANIPLGTYYKFDIPVKVKENARTNFEFVNVASQQVADDQGNTYSSNTETRQNQILPKMPTPSISTQANSNGNNVYSPATNTPFQDKVTLKDTTKDEKVTEQIILWRVPAGDVKRAQAVWKGSKDIIAKGGTMDDLVNTVIDTSNDTEAGTYYVFTEELYKTSDTTNGVPNKGATPLATHNDLTDKEQSVYLKLPVAKTPTPPTTPTVGDTAVKYGLYGVIAGIIVLGGVGAYAYKTRKRDDEAA